MKRQHSCQNKPNTNHLSETYYRKTKRQHSYLVLYAIFLTAFMPDTKHQPSYLVDQLFEETSSEELLDTQFSVMSTSNPSRMSVFFGHDFLTLKLYHLCPPEDVELGKMLVRPGSLFEDDLSKANKFSNEGYGSVKRVYVVCDADICVPKEFQRWMIQDNPVDEVMEIKGADHMAMLSKPQQLSDCLSHIAHNYA